MAARSTPFVRCLPLCLSLLALIVAPARAFNLNTYLQQPVVKGEQHGILVYDLDNEQPIATYHDEDVLIPASNVKFLTALAALDVLGPFYQFETPFYLVPGGTGGPPTLVVQLSGDPTWNKKFFPNVTALLTPLINQLRAEGVTRLDRLVVNDGLLPAPGRPPDWEAEDIVYHYAPVASAAGLEKNSFALQVGPKCISGKPQFTVYPPQRVVTLQNNMTCSTKGTPWVKTEKAGRNIFSVKGHWRTGRTYEEDYSVDDPAVFLADAFAMTLSKAGIVFEQGATVSRQPLPDVAREVFRQRSVPLSAILTYMMHKSDNYTAEVLFHLVGTQLSGRFGHEGARDGMQMWLSRRDLQGITWMDGSGLSRENRMTARQLGRAYLLAWREPLLRTVIGTLAVGGESGTLEKRFRGKYTKIAQGHFRGKTGAMRGIATLSGVLTTTGGRHLLVVSFQNGHTTSGTPIRAWQDQVVAALYKAY